MREILFRGKRIDNGEWVSSGNLITFTDEGEGRQFFIPQVNAKCTCTHDEQDNIISFNSGMFYKVDPEPVGQFTGMTDKNGKRIFEGDVVRFDSGVFVVRFYDCRMGFGFSGQFGRGCVAGFTMTNWEDIEVLGNIHDNPELLGGGEDG